MFLLADEATTWDLSGDWHFNFVHAFVSAWNKKVLGVLDEISRGEYNKIAKVNTKYDPKTLYRNYRGKINSYK